MNGAIETCVLPPTELGCATCAQPLAACGCEIDDLRAAVRMDLRGSRINGGPARDFVAGAQ